ncbi:protein kinase family protein [Paenibacillus kyungheensis]|uniref:Protein kinase family protein n=1 Tax=Paenibacillus kyungheensis TaxID=1452732 RepID=A0AAX3M0K1_9BACL|nr:protein kinase family protein [Paenibacillus kyungheensis]WCT55676.1 protein kinase family protein [Paenibacillus kyungheensis]
MKALQRIQGHIMRWIQERHFAEGQLIHERYKICRRLGKGSYGVTYLCEDIQTAQTCVLKRVYPLRGGHVRAQLIYERECRAMSAIDHPSIPSLLDTFQYHHYHCLVMEYIEGHNVGEWIFEQGLTFTELQSLQWIKQLVEVVTVIHQQGWVHRDISLSNVIYHQHKVYLIDLGLMWQQGEGTADVALLDELVSGDQEEKRIRRALDVTSDFYGLGHLLLFLLYSYEEEGNSHSSLTDRQERSWEEELQLHPRTHQMIRKMLLVAPEQPYQHIDEIAQAIDRIITDLESLPANNSTYPNIPPV